MIIVGTFYQSIDMEIALSQIEKRGIPAEKMLVIFMNEYLPVRSNKNQLKDIHSSSFEIGIAFATGLAVIGSSLGFKFFLGPIITGVLAAIIGFSIGYSIYYFTNRKKSLTKPIKQNEVTIIIECPNEQKLEISELLWRHKAISVGIKDNKG
ncbi:MAG TPA: hypothetical protein VNR61_02990 [Niallia sp.]|nr:hypothetical protein [Niallia sp.]